MSDKTLVTFILDKSGSMGMIIPATLEAFNAYLDELKRGDTDIDFTLVQFDTTGLEKTWHEVPVKDVPGLSTENYRPAGGTPLIDAVYKTIRALEKAVENKTTPPKVVVCIQTDGEENSSRDHTWSELKELIGQKQAEGWQFNFMGAGIDAYDQAGKMGLGVGQTMSYDPSKLATTRAAFQAQAMNTTLYASGIVCSTSYNTAQKIMSGDQFDPDRVSPVPEKSHDIEL